MNKTYRTIWSKLRDAYVVVAEIVAGNGGPSRGQAAFQPKYALQTVRDVLDAPVRRGYSLSL